jgi:hypothetical protein
VRRPRRERPRNGGLVSTATHTLQSERSKPQGGAPCSTALSNSPPKADPSPRSGLRSLGFRTDQPCVLLGWAWLQEKHPSCRIRVRMRLGFFACILGKCAYCAVRRIRALISSLPARCAAHHTACSFLLVEGLSHAANFSAFPRPVSNRKGGNPRSSDRAHDLLAAADQQCAACQESGEWRQSRRIVERRRHCIVRCRAHYSRAGSNSYTVNATCATASGRAAQTARVRKVGENSYSGSFYNSEYSISGVMHIVVHGTSQTVRLTGDSASGVINLSR